MRSSSLAYAALAIGATAHPSWSNGQTVLKEQGELPDDALSIVRNSLLAAQIIPTVLDDFLPTLLLDVSWPSGDNVAAHLGNDVNPSDLQKQPKVTLFDESLLPISLTNKEEMNLVITLTDPDAPSRTSPKWSEMCHWVAYNIPTVVPPTEGSSSRMSFADIVASIPPIRHNKHKNKKYLKKIVSYKPPGPPPKTGKHRYVFTAFAPANGTTDKLHLTKPAERQHWGYGEGKGKNDTLGVRQWAKENGLVAVAANFVYAQNEKQ